MTYPSGTVLNYNYGSANGLNDVISRLDNLSNGTTQTLEAYAYLGLSTVVDRMHPQDGIDLTYIKKIGESNGDAGDQYIGLDRFGRVVDQRWLASGSGSDVDRYQYTYDRDGNVASKVNTLDSALDETYTYDGLNRLTATTRNGTSNNYQSFALNALGSMTGLTNGTNSALTQSYNSQNQLIGFSTANGNSVTIAYDNNGNTTTDDLGRTQTYDAWNRLVTVKSGTVTLTSYAYDGQNWRIQQTTSGTTTDAYFTRSWQVAEQRVGVSYGNAGTVSAEFVWSPVYVNALVLQGPRHGCQRQPGRTALRRAGCQ